MNNIITPLRYEGFVWQGTVAALINENFMSYEFTAFYGSIDGDNNRYYLISADSIIDAAIPSNAIPNNLQVKVVNFCDTEIKFIDLEN